MIALVRFLLSLTGVLLKPKLRLEAERTRPCDINCFVLRRRVGGRPWLTNGDRWYFVQIGPALDIIGVGSRAHRNGGHKSGRNAKIRAAVFPSPLAGHSHAAVEWGQLNLKWPPTANVGIRCCASGSLTCYQTL